MADHANRQIDFEAIEYADFLEQQRNYVHALHQSVLQNEADIIRHSITLSIIGLGFNVTVAGDMLSGSLFLLLANIGFLLVIISGFALFHLGATIQTQRIELEVDGDELDENDLYWKTKKTETLNKWVNWLKLITFSLFVISLALTVLTSYF